MEEIVITTLKAVIDNGEGIGLFGLFILFCFAFYKKVKVTITVDRGDK